MANDLGAALYAWIKTQASLTAILGAADACQFYPIAALEQKTPPYIVYEEERDDAYVVHDQPPTLASSRVKFACVGLTTIDCKALADALDTALLAFPGGLMGSVQVAKVQPKGSTQAYQWEEQQFAMDADFKFYYQR